MLKVGGFPATKVGIHIAQRHLLYSRRIWNKTQFRLPGSYKPNKDVIHKLPFVTCLKIWFKSLQPNRLRDLQGELLDYMISSDLQENANIKRVQTQVPINDDKTIFMNEVTLELKQNEGKPTKHVVFIHGYGAALGCFARNFQLINLLNDDKFNYKIHFLDNISFGLSSNPKLESINLTSMTIPKCVSIKLNDPDPTDPKKLYNKYYKLIDSYDLNVDEFVEYKKKFIPILKDLETYYTSAIDQWRINSGIKKIDYLVGHSYGGYWSGSYAVKYPKNLETLILLSPVGVERHMQAVTNPILYPGGPQKGPVQTLTPSLDPRSFHFLSRLPILSSKHIRNWYYYQPYLPRLLKWLGPWGVSKYYLMWYMKLFKINKLISKQGGAKKVFKSLNDLVYGTNKECHLLIEYLYNNMSKGSVSDIYIKNLLTPSTVSKWPLYDKFTEHFRSTENETTFKMHLIYGQFDFMNSEAGRHLVDQVNTLTKTKIASYHETDEGGHNLYLDNPFQMNHQLQQIITNKL